MNNPYRDGQWHGMYRAEVWDILHAAGVPFWRSTSNCIFVCESRETYLRKQFADAIYIGTWEQIAQMSPGQVQQLLKIEGKTMAEIDLYIKEMLHG